MTRMDRMTGVSRFVRRPRSCSIFAMTPDDDTQVIPASASAATGPQPSTSAISAPGTAFEQHVEKPGGAGSADAAEEFVRAVLESEHQQEQDHADLGADLDELAALR